MSNSCVIDVKMGRSNLENRNIMPRLPFCSNMYWDSYIVAIAKAASKKIAALICSRNFFLLWLLVGSVNLVYDLPWKTVFMSGLVLLAATRTFGVNYRNRNIGLLLIHLKLCLII